jgi:DNA-binding transcriptional LysR family regulator
VGYLGPIVSDFLKRYPDVRVEMHCTGRVVDLIEERFDLGVRAGTLTDSTLIARTLGNAKWLLVATPAYLKRRGRPKSPEDLKTHDCLLFAAGTGGPAIRLENGDQSVQVPVTPRLLVGDLDILEAGATAGLGIALLPAFHCVEGLRARRLERVLREWNAPATPIHVVYPSSRHISPKVSRFVEHLQQRMTPPPWELGPVP